MAIRTGTSAWATLALGAAALVWALTQVGARHAPAARGTAEVPPESPRIVALVGGTVDTLDAIGALDDVVAVGGRFHYPGTEHKEHILSDEAGGATNPEAILALRPDLVLVARELVPALAGRGLPILVVPQDTFPEMRSFVTDLGRKVGREAAAQAALDRMDAKIAEIRERVASLPKVRVYWESSAPGRTRGPGTAVHEMIELAGGTNIYRDARIPRPTISMETILAADPEVIVLNLGSQTPEDVCSRQGWNRISAVRNGRVYVIPESERAVTLFSPRCAECCERTFLRWFHPELFADGEGR